MAVNKHCAKCDKSTPHDTNPSGHQCRECGHKPKMQKESKRSIPLTEKLDNLFIKQPDVVSEEFDMLIDTSMSLARFDNKRELSTHLTEGALLNINALGSHALSIPSGEYMVWVTDVGHTMLVPTQEQKTYGEVFGEVKNGYDILTPTLLDNWPKLERVIAEEGEEGENSDRSDGSDNESGTERPEGQKIQSRVNPADIDRNPILRAMEDRGLTVTSLATAVGVQAPAISRLLRVPKDVQGDPGGRNPSMGLAARISKTLRVDPTALFPDIFGAAAYDYEPRNTPGNRGSGMDQTAAGNARMNKTWSKGEA